MTDPAREIIGKYIGVLAIILSALYSTSAQATCPTFHTLTNGTTADASQVMDNFNYILQCPNFTGSVGIGTASPAGLLDIQGSGTAWTRIKSTGGNANLIVDRANTSSASQIYLYTGGNADYAFGTTDSGLALSDWNVYNYGTNNWAINVAKSNDAFSVRTLASCTGINTNAYGTMSCASDARLKDIQGEFRPGFAAIQKIVPQTYAWKQGTSLYDGGVLYSGFIAQNIRDAIPQAVNENSQGYLQVSTTTILAAAVNAIKELKAELKTANVDQALQIKQLHQEIAALKAQVRFASNGASEAHITRTAGGSQARR